MIDKPPEAGNDPMERYSYLVPLPPPTGPDGAFLRITENPDHFDYHRSPVSLRTYSTASHGLLSLVFEGYEIPRAPDVPDTDRLELHLSHPNDDRATALEFGEWRYLRFFVYVPSTFGLNRDGTRNYENQSEVAQVWQKGSSSVGPALAIKLQSDKTCQGKPSCSTVEMVYEYINQECNDELAAASGIGELAHKTFYRQTLSFGRWYGFLVAMMPMFKPGPSDPVTRKGAVMVWSMESTDGKKWLSRCAPVGAQDAGDGLHGIAGIHPFHPSDSCNKPDPTRGFENEFYWGLRPRAGRKASAGSSAPTYRLWDTFAVRVGMYRQPWFPAQFWLDSIKLSNDENLMPADNGATDNMKPTSYCGY